MSNVRLKKYFFQAIALFERYFVLLKSSGTQDLDFSHCFENYKSSLSDRLGRESRLTSEVEFSIKLITFSYSIYNIGLARLMFSIFRLKVEISTVYVWYFMGNKKNHRKQSGLNFCCIGVWALQTCPLIGLNY